MFNERKQPPLAGYSIWTEDDHAGEFDPVYAALRISSRIWAISLVSRWELTGQPGPIIAAGDAAEIVR
jgi:hypothetical protein